MIPSTNNKLLISEDWKKVYQSFKNADFKSYDFETLKRTMISYLQENYPEDFNDYIESSEYIALIDLIAYLGQNLSFRIDLNARENFIETAQRRESILRLAQLISYVPKRNSPANGFLKITAISTTDNVIDSNGINLANSVIVWNDTTNSNWYQQFITILNSSMSSSFSFGKPYDRNTVDGINTEQYRINSSTTDVPIFGFTKSINGTSMNFEIVPSTFSGKTVIYEETPKPNNSFSLIYKDDNKGTSSNNTGFFTHFRQGTLGVSEFYIENPVPNEIIGVNVSNINDTDVWLWQLDSNNQFSTLWTKVPAVVGNNVIYNSLNQNERNIYSVTSRDEDQIDLNFADGNFGNLPKGRFKLFYRQSNGLTYSIKPEQMSGIVIEVPYYNKLGQGHTLTLTMGLKYTVSNSSGPESNSSIQLKAPQAFYSQNRMVTAEDYNIVPLTLSSDILKIKSVNRISSGLSKYFDLNDVSGKYSNTNIFANDGILYKDETEEKIEFTFSNRNEILSVIKSKIVPTISNPSIKSFYYDKYSRPKLNQLGVTWTQVNKTPQGYFKIPGATSSEDLPVNVGSFTSDNLRYVGVDSLIKFVPPTGKYFLPNGKLISTQTQTTLNYIWVKVIQVIGDGSNSGQGMLDTGQGPIVLSQFIDSNSIPEEVIPKFSTAFSAAFENEIANLCFGQRNFALSFDSYNRVWNIILDTNLDLYSPFSLQFQNNRDNSNRDSSWLIAFAWQGKGGYKVRFRKLNYIFESKNETAFFVDYNNVNYDFVNNNVIKDQIDVLSINPSYESTGVANSYISGWLGKDFKWQIDSSVVDIDGYQHPKKVIVSFYDFNSSGQIDDPDAFNKIVSPDSISGLTEFKDKFVYFKKTVDGLRYNLVNDVEILAYPTEEDVSDPIDGQLYYFYDPSLNLVKRYDNSLKDVSDPWVYDSDTSLYFGYPGRADIKFHYKHNSGENRRIDPSKSNIIDVYLLTNSYDAEYRNWLLSGIGNEPLPPTSQSLEQNYGSNLESIKSISDELVFQPVRYKILFGTNATENLQATFKAVKNIARPVSDNELKTKILNAIQEFFSLENWDFGQSFYFSELSTYVMNLLTPDITNFVIVPKSNNLFGNLYEINCLGNEIFISGATIFDIEIIDAVTITQLNQPVLLNNGI